MAGISATYVSATSFTITGDVTEDFNSGRRIRANCGGTYKYGSVDTSSYSNPNTTVVLDGTSEAIDSGLTVVYFGVQADAEGTLPNHTHDTTAGEGGSLSTDYVDYKSTGSFFLKDLLIYYGYVNSFNYDDNDYTNELISKDMAQYNMIVFGDGVADPGHGDYANFIIVVERLKVLKPDIELFGYVSVDQAIADFKTAADLWDDVPEMDGILLDEAGYDFGVTRAECNEAIDYVHTLNCNIAFINAWVMNHIIGVENDASYPNTTYNPTAVASTLTMDDWYLLESYPCNTTSYSGTNGYVPMVTWLSRGTNAIENRDEFKLNVACVSVVDKDDADAVTLADFHYLNAMMYSLDAQGVSDSYYGASSSTVPLYPKLNWNNANMGLTYTNETAVKVASDNWQIHYRYTDKGQITCDHTGTDPVITYTSNIYDNIVLRDSDGGKWLLTVTTSGIVATTVV